MTATKFWDLHLLKKKLEIYNFVSVKTKEVKFRRYHLKEKSNFYIKSTNGLFSRILFKYIYLIALTSQLDFFNNWATSLGFKIIKISLALIYAYRLGWWGCDSPPHLDMSTV